MTTPSSSQSEPEVPKEQSTKKTVMREYLESKDPALKFQYPSGKNHHDFGAGYQNFLILKSKISVKPGAKSSVYSYRRNTDLSTPLTFERDVIVKQIRGNIKKSNTDAVKEVWVQQFLYHPHITAFLGTFTTHERLSIVIYPVACGDLGDFMKEVCDELQLEEYAPVSSANSDLGGHLPGEKPFHRGHARNNSKNNKDLATTAENVRRDSPSQFPWSLRERMQRLRSWFPCLCAALQYLHKTGVRHKDIKPANIVIDFSGSALLTDFGISRLFPPGTEHVTNDQWDHTPEYASPEMMKGRDEKRSDPSDVFSLGCVFIEMATVLLRGDLDEFSDFRSDYQAQEGLTKYYKSLPRVYEWIKHGCAPPDTPTVQSDTNEAIFSVLPAIQDMLAEIPEKRPLTKDLWGIFKDVSIVRCPDCDFRLEETRWKPSTEQLWKTREAFTQRSALLGAETLRAGESRNPGALPSGEPRPSHENEYVTSRQGVDDIDNPSGASNLERPLVLVHPPTAPTENLQTRVPHSHNPLTQRTIRPQENGSESAGSSVQLQTVSPASNDSGGSTSTASNDQYTLVYCVRERSLRIQRFSSIDQRRRKELCLLPPGRNVVISTLKGDLIATVDLGKIKDTSYTIFWCRRQLGHFPHVCVLF